MTSWLVAENARIEGDGAVLVDGLSFEADGARVALVGDWSPLFRALSRRASLTRGEIRVLGAPLDTAIARGGAGVALAIPATAWTALEYLVTSARLAGFGRHDSGRMAQEGLDLFGLGPIAKRAMASLDPRHRRAIGVVHATLGAPPVILLDRPFAGLSGADADFVSDVVDRAATGRLLGVSVDAPAAVGTEASHLARADRVVVLERGRVVRSGAPSQALAMSPRCAVRVARAVGPLADALVAEGVRVERVAQADASGEDGPGRLVVHLPPGQSPSLIVRAALGVAAPLLELVPIGFARASS